MVQQVTKTTFILEKQSNIILSSKADMGKCGVGSAIASIIYSCHEWREINDFNAKTFQKKNKEPCGNRRPLIKPYLVHIIIKAYPVYFGLGLFFPKIVSLQWRYLIVNAL